MENSTWLFNQESWIIRRVIQQDSKNIRKVIKPNNEKIGHIQ